MKLNINALNQAAKELNAGAFKLYIYFMKNQNDYTFALSNKVVEDEFGMKKTQYDSAIKELIDKGFLQLQSGNLYKCFDYPKKK